MNTLLKVAIFFAVAALTCAAQPKMPRYRFENYTTANGLPNDHVYSVLVDGERIWAGTDNGLALFEDGKWKTYNTADGLAHRAVLSLHSTSAPEMYGPERWGA